MAPSAAEISAVAKALETDLMADWHPPLELPGLSDLAALAIDALDRVRWAKDKWVMVARIKLPGGQWHNFAMGPYSTLGQAQRAGESFMPSTLVHKRDGDCFFRAVPVVTNDKAAWEAVRPEQVDKNAYIRESVEKWDPWIWARAVAERDGWAHKPKVVKEITDKSEDHA
jgi:hypothetical protein